MFIHFSSPWQGRVLQVYYTILSFNPLSCLHISTSCVLVNVSIPFHYELTEVFITFWSHCIKVCCPNCLSIIVSWAPTSLTSSWCRVLQYSHHVGRTSEDLEACSSMWLNACEEMQLPEAVPERKTRVRSAPPAGAGRGRTRLRTPALPNLALKRQPRTLPDLGVSSSNLGVGTAYFYFKRSVIL